MTATIGSSGAEAVIPARGVGVEITTGYRVRQTPNFERSYWFYLDGELIDSLHFFSQCPVSCLFQGQVHTIPLYTSFTLGVDDPLHPFELDHGETSQKFTVQYSSIPCATGVWHPNCSTIVRISQGSELGTLIGPNGEDLGDVFVGSANAIKQVRFSANGRQPDGEAGEAVVEISSRGITSSVTFQIRRTLPPVHRFSVVAEPDTARHGKSSILLVTAEDEEGEEVEIPPDTPLDMFVGAGREAYGDLFGLIHGSPVKADQLSEVRYDQAKSGGIVYSADGKNPVGMDPPQVPIGVQLRAQPDVSGVVGVTVQCTIDSFKVLKQWTGGWENENYDHYVWSIEERELHEGVVVDDTVYWKVKQKGCALSTLAMMFCYWKKDETPGTLNAKMTPNYINRESGAINWLFAHTFPDIRFDRIDGAFPPAVRDRLGRVLKTSDGKDSLNFSAGKTVPLTLLKELVQKCIPAAVYVVNPDRNTGHFVVALRESAGTIEIADPGKNRSTLREYNNKIYGIRYLTGVL